MTGKAAFQATYSDWKLIKTRSAVQIVFEVPVEQAGLAYEVLGGMPKPGAEVWCAIARLQQQPKEDAEKPRPHAASTSPTGGAHRSWHEMSPAQQAGILCAEPTFWKFCGEWLGGTVSNEEECIHAVREYCGVQSRKQIVPNEMSGMNWGVMAGEYRAWMRAPEVV